MRTEEAGRPWADPVPEVLRLVALRLPPPDLSSFRKVCKAWRNLPIESSMLGRSPLFLFSPCSSFGDEDKLYLYSPLYNKTFFWAASREALDIYKSPESYLMHSKDGWLVFFRFDEPERPAIVFVNLFLSSTTAPAVIKWRMPANCSTSTLVSMSAPPTDPSCIFLLVNFLYRGNQGYRIKIITTGDGTNWKEYNIGGAGRKCNTSPIFCGGLFYCLTDPPGALGVYYPPRSWDEHYMGKMVNPCSILVESDGELLNVVWSPDISSRLPVDPLVYKLNILNRKWEELRELRGRALFLDRRWAISAVAEIDGMKDRIFRTKFHDIAVKEVRELHRSAGGDPRPVPRSHAGSAKLARRMERKMVGMTLPCSLQGTGKGEAEEERCIQDGFWLQPDWG